jgi:uncharacterized OsmC-like protein
VIQKKTEAAIYRPKVTSRHSNNLYTESLARERLVQSDYGEAAGGDNQAPNSVELLRAAMASCLEAAFFEFAVHERFTVNALAVNVEGTLDKSGLFVLFKQRRRTRCGGDGPWQEIIKEKGQIPALETRL